MRLRDLTGSEVLRWAWHLAPQIKGVLQYPRRLAPLIDEKSPWLSRPFLSVASNWADPFLLGMGLQVEEWSDIAVAVRMPAWARNTSGGGQIHSAALLAVGELTSRLFWERFLTSESWRLEVHNIHARFLHATNLETRAVLKLSEADREAVLYEVRAQGEGHLESTVLIFDRRDYLVAEVVIEWRAQILPGERGLGPGQGSKQGSEPGTRE